MRYIKSELFLKLTEILSEEIVIKKYHVKVCKKNAFKILCIFCKTISLHQNIKGFS
jgi:hypothetical protein